MTPSERSRPSLDDPIVSDCWRAIMGDELVWRSWEGDHVIYSALSGNTHTLDVLSGEILRAVLDGQHRSEDLQEVVARFLEVPTGPELAETVNAAIERLQAAGLIEDTSDCR